mgnify:CR=1 FL=1
MYNVQFTLPRVTLLFNSSVSKIQFKDYVDLIIANFIAMSIIITNPEKYCKCSSDID